MAGCFHGALIIKLPLRNGQESGLRSSGRVLPAHALCLAKPCPDEMIERGGGRTHDSDSLVTQLAAARLHEQGVHWILSSFY